jgi:3-dehydroquinate dehydratase
VVLVKIAECDAGLMKVAGKQSEKVDVLTLVKDTLRIRYQSFGVRDAREHRLD